MVVLMVLTGMIIVLGLAVMGSKVERKEIMLENLRGRNRLYYTGGAWLMMSGFFLSLAVSLSMLVDFINPAETIYPTSLVDYQERFVIYDENGQVVGQRYDEEEIKEMFEAERRQALQQIRAGRMNDLIVAGTILLVSGGGWWYFNKKLKSE
jgi:hypothetical protein